MDSAMESDAATLHSGEPTVVDKPSIEPNLPSCESTVADILVPSGEPTLSSPESTTKVDTVTSSGEQAAAEDDDMKNVYHVKWIDWSEQWTPIVTQNENGPCPLLAIFNVLLLSKKITLANSVEFISSSQIISQIADVIWDNMPEDLPEHERLNYEQNMSDAMAVFPNLETGLDVNVKFSSVTSFECTPELAVFDLLRISLYHGWLVDPQDISTKEILGDMSYNQVVEKVILYTSSDDQELLNKGLVAQEFLESTASQLTCHGIVSLRDEMQPGALAVLFRNNHFSTIHRHQDELFTLITDLGFLKEKDVIWESLSSVQGDSHFVDGSFLNSPQKSEATLSPDVAQTTDHDYQFALSVQQDQFDISANSDQPPAGFTSDYHFAMHLQRQEEEIASQQAQARTQPRPAGQSAARPPNSSKHASHEQAKNDSKCTIL